MATDTTLKEKYYASFLQVDKFPWDLKEMSVTFKYSIALPLQSAGRPI